MSLSSAVHHNASLSPPLSRRNPRPPSRRPLLQNPVHCVIHPFATSPPSLFAQNKWTLSEKAPVTLPPEHRRPLGPSGLKIYINRGPISPPLPKEDEPTFESHPRGSRTSAMAASQISGDRRRCFDSRELYRGLDN
jgi:hypothetical protein